MAFASDSRRVERQGPGRARLELPAGWTAPRMFGGMAMACALRVAELDRPAAAAGLGATSVAGAASAVGAASALSTESAMVPLAASASFHRPLAPGPVEATLTELAATRRTRAVQVRLGEALSVTATLVPASEFAPGGRRGSGAAPAVPAPEQLRPLPESSSGRRTGAAALAAQVDWRAVTPWRERAGGGELLAWLAPRRVPWIAGGYLDPLWYCVAADLLGPALYDGVPFTVATVTLDLQILGLTRSPWLLQRVIPDAPGPWAAGRVELWDRAGRLVATAAQRARLFGADPVDEPWCVTAFGSGRSCPRRLGSITARDHAKRSVDGRFA